MKMKEVFELYKKARKKGEVRCIVCGFTISGDDDEIGCSKTKRGNNVFSHNGCVKQ